MSDNDYGAASPADLASLDTLLSAVTASAGMIAEGVSAPAVDDAIEYQDIHAMSLDAVIIGVYDDPSVVDLRAGQLVAYAVHYDADGAPHSWKSR